MSFFSKLENKLNNFIQTITKDGNKDAQNQAAAPGGAAAATTAAAAPASSSSASSSSSSSSATTTTVSWSAYYGSIACDDASLKKLQHHMEQGGFSSNKILYITAVAPCYVFTTQQAATLIKPISMSNDKLEAIELLRNSLSNPHDSQPLSSLLHMSSDQQQANTLLASFQPARAQTMAHYRIEDDGHRSAADIQRLYTALDQARMSSDKVQVIQDEIKNHPTPPLEPHHLTEILKKFNFSNDRIEVLNALVPPGFVYPMTCAQVLDVLKTFNMSSDKIEILPALKKLIIDGQNKLDIIASFNFSSDKEEAERILRDVRVVVAPPGPSPEIMAKLQRVGRCPAGYTWRQVRGGWRCAAGGHFVSDQQLAQA